MYTASTKRASPAACLQQSLSFCERVHHLLLLACGKFVELLGLAVHARLQARMRRAECLSRSCSCCGCLLEMLGVNVHQSLQAVHRTFGCEDPYELPEFCRAMRVRPLRSLPRHNSHLEEQRAVVMW